MEDNERDEIEKAIMGLVNAAHALNPRSIDRSRLMERYNDGTQETYWRFQIHREHDKGGIVGMARECHAAFWTIYRMKIMEIEPSMIDDLIEEFADAMDWLRREIQAQIDERYRFATERIQ